MSDTSNAPGAPGAPDEGAARPQAGATAPISLAQQYVYDLSFENPKAAELFTGQLPAQPQMKLGVDVGFRDIGQDRHEVRLFIEARAVAGEETIYLVELDYRAIAQLGQEVKEELKAPLLAIEAPRMMFPFARQVIAQAVNQGGLAPLLLQPIDFLAIYQQKVARAKEAQGDAPDGGDADAAGPPQGNA